MIITLLAVALAFLALGYYIGREAGKSPGQTRCPKCRQKRLYYCRGCGLHFDDGDNPIAHRDYERLCAPDSLFSDGKLAGEKKH